MIGEEGSENLCVAANEVVQEIMDEKVDIGRERSTWLTGYKPLPPQLEVIVGVEPDEPENISDLEEISLLDDLYGVTVSGKWDRRSIDFPLCDLDVVGGGVNEQIVSDYALWFANR